MRKFAILEKAQTKTSEALAVRRCFFKRRHSEGSEATRRIPCMARAKNLYKFKKSKFSQILFSVFCYRRHSEERQRPKNPQPGERVESLKFTKN